jgi:hypothetical protein
MFPSCVFPHERQGRRGNSTLLSHNKTCERMNKTCKLHYMHYSKANSVQEKSFTPEMNTAALPIDQRDGRLYACRVVIARIQDLDPAINIIGFAPDAIRMDFQKVESFDRISFDGDAVSLASSVVGDSEAGSVFGTVTAEQ